jgi:uncharacterized membrane protein YkvI
MKKFQRAKRTSLVLSFSLIFTFTLLIQANLARAGEVNSIKPNLGFDFVTLLAKQSATFDTSQSIVTDVHTVGVLSIGNNSLKADLKNIKPDTGTAGIWWVAIIGSGSVSFIDIKYGLVPLGGQTAQIDVGVISVALAMGGLILTSPVSAASPVNYQISVGSVPYE